MLRFDVDENRGRIERDRDQQVRNVQAEVARVPERPLRDDAERSQQRDSGEQRGRYAPARPALISDQVSGWCFRPRRGMAVTHPARARIQARTARTRRLSSAEGVRPSFVKTDAT